MIRYSYKTFSDFIARQHPDVVHSGKKSAYNVACGFDIEDSSFYREGMKYACMYEWTFGFDSTIFYGRTWDEFKELITVLSVYFDVKHSLFIYVHSLAHEFQFIKNLFEWESILSISERNPITAKMKDSCIEFRCSYMLTGKSLEKLAKENLLHHTTKKLVGDLDYTLLRTPDTEMSDQELQYCENDVQILLDYISEQIEYEGNILKIPYTKTGYVRRCIKEKCLKDNPNKEKYRAMISGLYLTRKSYLMGQMVFQGGFTHASCVNADITLHHVAGYDEKSAYPSMIRFKFPVTKPMEIKIESAEEVFRLMKEYCLILHVEFFDIEPKIPYEHYITMSKCIRISPADHLTLDNGRVISAHRIEMFITELDFDLINDFYQWKDIHFVESFYMRKSYLPTPIIESFLEFFERKTQLDGVEGQEMNYMLAKQNLNSAYGMMVTNPLRDTFDVIKGEWTLKPKDIDTALIEYNTSWSRFTFYYWGIWITAYNRHTLLKTFEPIIKNGDHVYSDTDSGKILHPEQYVDYFNEVNDRIDKEMVQMLKTKGIDPERRHPKKPNGKPANLGFFEYEGEYDMFKTIGAKRYMYLKDGKLHITISGVSKEKGGQHLCKKYNNDWEQIFDVFDDNLIFPAGETGKLTHTYIDEPFTLTVKDYKGKMSTIHEESYVHLEDAPYKLSLDDQYIDFLKGIQPIKPFQ